MKPQILLILTFAFSSLFAQVDTNKTFHIYFTPTQAIDYFSRPMLTIGSEVIVLKKIGFSAEYGYKYYNIHNYDSSMVTSSGNSYRMELKVYNLPFINFKRINNYFSVEYKHIDDCHDGIFRYRKPNNTDILEDVFGVKSHIDIFNVKYGIILGVGSVMFFDIYVGVGIRNRFIKNTDREYSPENGDKFANIEPTVSSYYLEESSGIYFNPTLGFKFGVRF